MPVGTGTRVCRLAPAILCQVPARSQVLAKDTGISARSERRDPEDLSSTHNATVFAVRMPACTRGQSGLQGEPDGSNILSGRRGAEKISKARQGHGHAPCQRRGAQIGRRAVDHASRRAASLPRPDRDQKGLRSRPMRRLHRSGRWPADLFMPHAGDHEGWRAGHDDRGSGARQHASSVAAGLHRP